MVEVLAARDLTVRCDDPLGSAAGGAGHAEPPAAHQLAPLPSHVPYALPKRLSNRVALFHVSWISILTQASLILRDSDELNRDQAFLLKEMARYFEHPHSGVKAL